MAKVRVWEMPGGALRVTVLAPNAQLPGETDDAFYARGMQRTLDANPSLQAATAQLDVEASALASLDRSKRYAWRLNAFKTGIVVDPTILPPVDPRAVAIDAEPSFNPAQKAAIKRILGIG